MNKPFVDTNPNGKGVSPAGTRRKQAARPLWKRPVPLLIIAVLTAFVIGGLRPSPIPVETAVISRGPLQVTVLEEGKTRIRERFVVSMPVAGMLNRVELEPGDHVEAGKTVLAMVVAQISTFLDPRTQAEAEARVSAAEAAIEQRKAELERIQQSAALAERELRRGTELRQTGAIAEKEWDALQTEDATQKRALKAAQFALRIAEFELDQSKAALVQPDGKDRKTSEPLRIVSPVSGVVLNRFEESARPLAAGTPILEVGDPENLEIEIELLSQDAVGLKPGSPVWIEQWGGGTPLPAKIRIVEPAAFTKISALGVEEQRVRVIADFVGDPSAWRSLGDRYRVEARVVTWAGENVLQIPAGALFRRGNDWMTFRVQHRRARLVPVGIGHHSGSAAEILSGLSEGERVIIHPPDGVADGVRVK